MNVIAFPKTVFIVELEESLSLSLKYLLETAQRSVRIFKRYHEFWAERAHREHDIVILNLERRETHGFEVLDLLLNMSRRPQIILISSPDLAFNERDAFSGGRVTMLFHPVGPKTLVDTINQL